LNSKSEFLFSEENFSPKHEEKSSGFQVSNSFWNLTAWKFSGFNYLEPKKFMSFSDENLNPNFRKRNIIFLNLFLQENFSFCNGKEIREFSRKNLILLSFTISNRSFIFFFWIEKKGWDSFLQSGILPLWYDQFDSQTQARLSSKDSEIQIKAFKKFENFSGLEFFLVNFYWAGVCSKTYFLETKGSWSPSWLR